MYAQWFVVYIQNDNNNDQIVKYQYQEKKEQLPPS